jgi:proteasome accessory factor B
MADSGDEAVDEAVDEAANPRRKAKQDRTARIVKVLTILQAHGRLGLTAQQVGDRTSTSKRTAYRDIIAIEEVLGFPLNKRSGRYSVSAETFLPPLRLTLPEAASVFIAARLATRFADTYDPNLYSAFLALQRTLPKLLGKHVVPALTQYASHPTDAKLNEHFAKLARAWIEQRVVEITYAPAAYDGDRTPSRRRVHPYLLEPSMQTHALYLIAHDEGPNAVRTFKVERILDVSVTPQQFTPPNADLLARSLKDAWDIISDQPLVNVELRFVPSVAARVAETVWHPSQSHETEADGSLNWRATVAGTKEIRLWILGWGDEVEVLAPAHLRADVARTHVRAARRYEG